MNVSCNLSKVREEVPTFTPPPSPRTTFPVLPTTVVTVSHATHDVPSTPIISQNSLRRPHNATRKPSSSSSSRIVPKSKLDPSSLAPPQSTGSSPGSPRRATSSSAVSVMTSPAKDPSNKSKGSSSTSSASNKQSTAPGGSTGASASVSVKYCDTPQLSPQKNVELVPATIMHWSRAPVYGYLPSHNVRAHSVTLVDQTAWLFGGCDERECWGNMYCFDIDTMYWSEPEVVGDVPPRCRAHTATLLDKKIVFFGGGQGSHYYNDVYVFDTVGRRWTRPTLLEPIIPPDPTSPPPPPPSLSNSSSTSSTKEKDKDKDKDKEENDPMPRRAHTAVLYNGKIWIFGGGNGMTALNDLWCLHVQHLTSSGTVRWEKVICGGKERPSPRGYHTANVIGNVMVVVGGSDGKECFSDVWCLNMDTLIWDKIPLVSAPKRLSHSATQVGSYLFIMGGHDGGEYSSELLFFNLVTLQYETRPIVGKPPSSRGYHACILADSRLFLFGGFNGHSVYSDVHILDLAAAAYLPQVTSFSIEVASALETPV